MTQPPKKDNFTRNIVIAVVIGVLLIMVVPTVLSKRTDSTAKTPASVSADRNYGITFNGDLTGVPVIDVYEDFQCPVCRSFESVVGSYITQLVKENKVKVIYHPLSFIGPESVRAANAAACAAEDSKFDEFHTLLYKTQSTSENSGLWSNDNLVGLGATIGLTSDSFKKCVNNGGFLGWVNNIAADGAKKNVNSTPTVFVNGKEIDRNTQYMDLNGFTAALVAAGLK